MIKNFINFICLIGMLTFIFMMSSMPGAASSSLSGGITTFLYQFINMPYQELHHCVRKAAHVLEFMFLFLASTFYIQKFNLKKGIAVILAYILTLACALFDEFHQSFVADRCSSMNDVVIDTFVPLILMLVLIVIAYLKNKKMKLNF